MRPCVWALCVIIFTRLRPGEAAFPPPIPAFQTSDDWFQLLGCRGALFQEMWSRKVSMGSSGGPFHGDPWSGHCGRDGGRGGCGCWRWETRGRGTVHVCCGVRGRWAWKLRRDLNEGTEKEKGKEISIEFCKNTQFWTSQSTIPVPQQDSHDLKGLQDSRIPSLQDKPPIFQMPQHPHLRQAEQKHATWDYNEWAPGWSGGPGRPGCEGRAWYSLAWRFWPSVEHRGDLDLRRRLCTSDTWCTAPTWSSSSNVNHRLSVSIIHSALTSKEGFVCVCVYYQYPRLK